MQWDLDGFGTIQTLIMELSTYQNYFHWVVHTNWHSISILSGIIKLYSGIHRNSILHFILYSFRHWIWQMFWHSISHIIWLSEWYNFWNSLRHYNLALSGILSDILSDILPGMLSDWHTFWHSIWHTLWHSIWYTFWFSIWHTLWHSIWHTFLKLVLTNFSDTLYDICI